MIPWGDRENLCEDEFYNRIAELDNLKSLLNTTSNGNAPQILFTGLRGVGKKYFLKKLKKKWMMTIWSYISIFPEQIVIKKEKCL